MSKKNFKPQWSHFQAKTNDDVSACFQIERAPESTCIYSSPFPLVQPDQPATLVSCQIVNGARCQCVPASWTWTWTLISTCLPHSCQPVDSRLLLFRLVCKLMHYHLFFIIKINELFLPAWLSAFGYFLCYWPCDNLTWRAHPGCARWFTTLCNYFSLHTFLPNK